MFCNVPRDLLKNLEIKITRAYILTITYGFFRATNPNFVISIPNKCFINVIKYQELKYYGLWVIWEGVIKSNSLQYNMVNFLWWKPDQHPEAYSELCLISKMGRFAKFSAPNTVIPPNMNTFKVNNRRIRKRCETCSKLPIKTSEWRHYPSSGVFIVNFEQLYVW